MLRHRLALLIALALAAAACAPGSPTASSSSSGPAPSPAGPSVSPSGASAVPGTPEPSPTDPGGSIGPSPSDSSPGPSGIADACAGSETKANRDFFINFAGAVSFPVLCAVLPDGWFLEKGNYRLAGGGVLTVSYKGPKGATLALSEGAFCADPAGCVPPGTDAGDASFGTRTGTLVALADGGFAIVVDRGAPVSWLLQAEGLDEVTTRSLAAAVVQVAP